VSGIYAFVHNDSKKLYIGSSFNLAKRINDHLNNPLRAAYQPQGGGCGAGSSNILLRLSRAFFFLRILGGAAHFIFLRRCCAFFKITSFGEKKIKKKEWFK
jgi:hypothetical protein